MDYIIRTITKKELINTKHKKPKYIYEHEFKYEDGTPILDVYTKNYIEKFINRAT